MVQGPDHSLTNQARISMQYLCDGPGKTTWFRIETEMEAERESRLMGHAVAKHFGMAREAAVRTFKSSSSVTFEQLIGLEAHVQRTMPLFLTLRDAQGEGLATAMLPPGGRDDPSFQIIIVGKNNADPYPDHAPAIDALGGHFGLTLDRDRCFPYRR
jgi:hypothetical protein